ncbi:MAG TPA: hypothetical protein VHU40_21605 [Polyangia bacterium]|jgi:hypothetical protein|nr:hypothetical protein [Polyangia bacterium]
MKLKRKHLSTAFLLLACFALAGAACGRSPLDESKGTAGSGGTTGAGSTGVLPPSPGLFLCGSTICSTSSQQCCLGIDPTGGLGTSCGRIGAACAGAAFQCDEPADCHGSPAAPVCCFGLDSPAASSGGAGLGFGSRCESAAACAGAGRFILCATDADCASKVAGQNQVCCAAIGLPVCQPRCLPL